MANTAPMTSMLRMALMGDAAMSAVASLLMIGGAGILSEFLELPQTLLSYAGLVIIPYVILLGILAKRAALPSAMVWAVISVNILWSLASALLLVAGWVLPNAYGYAFVIVQAVAVLAFAEFQYFALRQASKENVAHPSRAAVRAK
jgi:hypothetical protein